LCGALGVSRGGFYAWLTRPRSQRSRSDEELAAKVRASFVASDRTYGARRVWHDLLAEGVSCGLHRIERLMRQQALRARPRRRRLPSGYGERQATPVAPNVLDRSFEAPAANRKWIADFTYIWTAEGWLYVAAVVDLFSRRVVGWSMSADMTAQLVTDALVMAIWRRGKPTITPRCCITRIVAASALNTTLRTYVEQRLAGAVMTPSGAAIPGPVVPWKGRRHGPRKDRRWARAWSPEQIARRLRIDFPDDSTMRISHEAIYQALFVQGRGALRCELTACLRTGRVLRVPRARVRRRGKGFVSPEIMISQRPAEAADRAVPGHWEGDLILGLGSSAIGTLVERTTRFTMLLHLPRLAGYGEAPRTKNGPALAGHGAEAVRDAIARTIITLPEELRRSLTWDQGAEMAQHDRLKIDAGVQVYFCDPQSPWQRGTNENTNGLLRQYFPKGTDLSIHSADEIAAVAIALNARPRKSLGWKTPAEALDELLS
jgi:IS30 family transposase